MAAVKRKAFEDSGVSHKSSRAADKSSARPQKKSRRDAGTDKPAAASKISASNEEDKERPPVASVLSSDERAFPRGGGGVLTPLEHRQIQIQATKDVLFEETGGKRRQDDGGIEGEFGEENASSMTRRPAKLQKRVKGKGKPKTSANGKDGEVVEGEGAVLRVRGLNSKRLTQGSVVLGQVAGIFANELLLDLPNNLSGHVSITNISSHLTEQFQDMASEAGDEHSTDGADADADEEGKDTDLKKLFYLGQYLRAVVLSAHGDSGEQDSKSKRRIELTLDPTRTNLGLDAAELKLNMVIQATVSSVADHGFGMDLGLSDKSVTGFMSSKQLPEAIQKDDVQPGAVYLCSVSGISSNGKIVKLSAILHKASDVRKTNGPLEISTIASLLPGMAVELLVSQASTSSIAGKLIGVQNASIDVVHCAATGKGANMEDKYKVGDKVRARVIFRTTESQDPVIGLSILEHILSFSSRTLTKSKVTKPPLEWLPVGTIIEKAKIVNVQPSLGVYIDVSERDVPAFVHISRLSDERVDALSAETGAFRIGTTHRARVLGYNAMDGVYLASLQKNIIEQKFLRLEDVVIGDVVKATVEKLIISATGSTSLILSLAKGITGLVPEIHLSDVHLQHPDRKFKEGLAVTARVLSVDLDRRQMRLTLKKSLVTSDLSPWTSFGEIESGASAVGTILRLDTKGALLQFYANVKGYLPAAQMSEAYIQDPSKHFRTGQAITVHATSVDVDKGRLGLSCRDTLAQEEWSSSAAATLRHGQLVSGVITDKSEDDITVDLTDLKCKATVPAAHLDDDAHEKKTASMKRVRIGQTLRDLVVVEIFPKRFSIIASNKHSLVNAAKSGKMHAELADIEENDTIHGFVRNITSDGIFLQTVGGLVGLLPKSQMLDNIAALPDFGVSRGQSLRARVLTVDVQQQRFALTQKSQEESTLSEPLKTKTTTPGQTPLTNPVDDTLQSTGDLIIGRITKAKIMSVKDSQLNVQLADNVQGRIDVSEAFAAWEDIKNRKSPLQQFKAKDEIAARVIGIHDARNHKFLPISHRGGKVPVFELSAKLEPTQSVSSLDQISVDSWQMAFVNNIMTDCIWVNLSPSVRGRIEILNLAEEASVLNSVEKKFPIGSAIRARVKNVNLETGHLDLSSKSSATDDDRTIDNISEGTLLAGKITKSNERFMLVQLGPDLVGQVGHTEFADDFSAISPSKYQKGNIILVCVLVIDRPNKKVALSLRASRILSSSLPVKDRSITKISDLKINDIVRGFVKNVADIGLFITLGYNVTGFARVSDLSDSYVKDWKSQFAVDSLVTGKVTSVDGGSQHVQLSLKESVVSTNYVPKTTFNDMSVGQIITGKIRKVEEFGVFIVVDNSNNVSGLCHRSEIAERRVEDVRKLYTEGDKVKAIVLKIEPEKRRISFGLKATYFADDGAVDGDEKDLSDDGGVDIDLDDGMDIDGDVSESNDDTAPVSKPQRGQGVSTANVQPQSADDTTDGLGPIAFNWDGEIDAAKDDFSAPVGSTPKDVTKRPGRAQEDITGEMDRDGPQTVDDFERLLLGNRHSSQLWVQYMSFFITQGQVDEARKIAERALKEIPIREQDEKKQVWFAYLNLEANFGNDESADEIFRRACEYNDAKEAHEHFASACIRAGKLDRAEEVYQAMTKKKDCSADVRFWLNYADFLFKKMNRPDRARALLQRADQSVVQTALALGLQAKLRRDLICRFAQLEYKCDGGDAERGRNSLEDLVTTYPRQWDVWDIYVDMERHHGAGENVRALYERMTAHRMNKRRATFVYKQWLAFEERNGSTRQQDHVKAKAAATAEQLRAAQ